MQRSRTQSWLCSFSSNSASYQNSPLFPLGPIPRAPHSVTEVLRWLEILSWAWRGLKSASGFPEGKGRTGRAGRSPARGSSGSPSEPSLRSETAGTLRFRPPPKRFCPQGDGGSDLYCRTCRQFFSSLHNKKEHLLGKQHLQNLTGNPPAGRPAFI